MVLVIYSETTIITFHGPFETHLDSLVGQALFGDDASTLIMGADPIPQVEKAYFEIISTAQKIVPDNNEAIGGKLREVELTFHLKGRAILDRVEAKLNLDPTKLIPSRNVMSEYRNMSRVCIHFILDEMRKESLQNGCSNSREGLEWDFCLDLGLALPSKQSFSRALLFNNLTTKLSDKITTSKL